MIISLGGTRLNFDWYKSWREGKNGTQKDQKLFKKVGKNIKILWKLGVSMMIKWGVSMMIKMRGEYDDKNEGSVYIMMIQILWK